MKKVWKVLLILFLAAIWLNVGYWGGKSWLDTYENQSINGFQKFQLGAWRFMEPGDSDTTSIATMIVISLLWPAGAVLGLGSWAVYGIVQAAVAVFHAVVWFFVVVFWRGIIAFLWNFFFCGGFFKLLGITSYHWILMGINLIAGVLLAQWGWHIEKKYLKPKNSTDSSAGMMAAIVSTIMCGFFAIFTLVFNAIYFWTTFYTIWSIALVISLILNIKKI